MAELQVVYSALSKILDERNLTVADLLRRIQEKGFRFDKKTIYRLAGNEPVRSLNLAAVAAIGSALNLPDPGKLIVWSPVPDPRARLRRIDAQTQTRLEELMAKNTEGTLDAAERTQFEKLGRLVEKLSLENARLLASRTKAPVAKKRSRRKAAIPRPGAR